MAVHETLSIGNEKFVAHRFGKPDARPRVYLQGALHADEASATVALLELAELLRIADEKGEIEGEIIVVPHCNPLGMKQFVLGRHLGRFSVAEGRNFNRGFPEIGPAVIDRLSQLTPDARSGETAKNIGHDILDDLRHKGSPLHRLHATLMHLAWGADFVIDVHADMEALVHIYTSPASWPAYEGLANRIGAAVAILADHSADAPFDEAHSNAWQTINDYLVQHGNAPGNPCATCTLELRGLADVAKDTALSDARALLGFLTDVGAVAASKGPGKPISTVLTTPLTAVGMVASPATGIVMPIAGLGDVVCKGVVVARLFDVAADGGHGRWQDITASCDGVVFARWHQRVIQSGMAICKIAGESESPESQSRLLD